MVAGQIRRGQRDRAPARGLRVVSPWRVRNDGRYVVAYEALAGEGNGYRVLGPGAASIVPFCDGTRTTAELKRAWLDIWSGRLGSPRQSADLFRQVIHTLRHDMGVLATSGPASPSLLVNPDRLIPDFADYCSKPLRLDRPLTAGLAITNRCNCNCLYCFAERRRCRERPLADWRRVLDDLVANEICMVEIMGGDLFVRPDAMTVLEELVSRGLDFRLSTKSLVRPEQARRMAAMGIGLPDPPRHLRRLVQVSLDSTDDETASLLTGRPGYLPIATRTVRALLDAGIVPGVKCVLTGHNADAAPGIVRRFSELGVVSFTFVLYGRSYYRHSDDLFYPPAAKAKIRDTMSAMREQFPDCRFLWQGLDPPKPTWKMWRARNMCSGGRIGMVIQPNGDVTLCDQVPHVPANVVGNVFRQGVVGVWQSKRVDDFLFPAAGAIPRYCLFHVQRVRRLSHRKGMVLPRRIVRLRSPARRPAGLPPPNQAHAPSAVSVRQLSPPWGRVGERDRRSRVSRAQNMFHVEH